MHEFTLGYSCWLTNVSNSCLLQNFFYKLLTVWNVRADISASSSESESICDVQRISLAFKISVPYKILQEARDIAHCMNTGSSHMHSTNQRVHSGRYEYEMMSKPGWKKPYSTDIWLQVVYQRRGISRTFEQFQCFCHDRIYNFFNRWSMQCLD